MANQFTLQQLQQMGATPLFNDGGTISNLPGGQLRPASQIQFQLPGGQTFQYQNPNPYAQGFTSDGTFTQTGGSPVSGGMEQTPAQLAGSGQYRDIPNLQGQTPEQQVATIKGSPQYDPAKGPQANYGQGNVPFTGQFNQPAPTIEQTKYPTQQTGQAGSPQQQTPKNAAQIQQEINDIQKKIFSIANAMPAGDVQSGATVRSKVNEGQSSSSSQFSDSQGGSSGTNMYPAPKSENPNDPTYQAAQKMQADINKVKDISNQWQSYLNSETNLQDVYNGLLNSTAGPTGQSQMGLQQQLLSTNNVMNMSESDIRTEIQNTGGFATESQIQALTSQRNKLLQLKANTLSNLLTAQGDYVNKQFDLYSTDRKTAEDRFNTAFNIADKMNQLDKQMYDTKFNEETKAYTLSDNQAKQISSLLNSYAANGYVPTTQQAQSYADIINRAYGISMTPEDIVAMATNKTQGAVLRMQLSQVSLQNKLIQGQIDTFKSQTEGINNYNKELKNMTSIIKQPTVIKQPSGITGMISGFMGGQYEYTDAFGSVGHASSAKQAQNAINDSITKRTLQLQQEYNISPSSIDTSATTSSPGSWQ